VKGPAEPRYDGSEIAVVGMAGRFPGAPDLDAFWRNLEQGVESIATFSDEEVRQAGEDPKLAGNPAYVRARSILEGVELFDAAFFGFSPREAEMLDPQLRLFLECAWSALEHAGHDPQRLAGRASLFAGASFSNYLIHNLYKNRPVMEAFGDLQTTIFNVHDSLVTMAGYKLNLKGACCAVQTFCSTSLVGVHLAVQNLLNYESDLALAGGVSVNVPQKRGYLYEEGGIVSPDGHCRAFDARAGGTVFGNGVGVVVLRRLEDARREGDTIHAVVRGSAANNDGSLKASFAAPGVVGQTEVVVEALSAAEVDPSTIGYVEAHGTGTRLGDPAEVSALTKAFRTRTDRKGFCALGSVKSNVGHLDAAAGVAGLIKVILSLQKGRIPPSLHFETPNPAIDFASSPFYVNTSLREWPRSGAPRRAGVSAFGVGGTNAHVIVEDAPEAQAEPSARTHQLLVLSAKTAEALEAAARRLADHLDAHSEVELADVAFTLQLGRGAFAHRRFVVAADRAGAVARLRAPEASATAVCERQNPPLVLRLMPAGPVPAGAWRDIYEREAGFRDAVRLCADAGGANGARMLEALYPSGAGASAPDPLPAELESLGAFALEYAVARFLESRGLRFEVVVGDGVGEHVASCVTGSTDIGAAIRLAVPPAAASGARGAAAVLRALPADEGRLCLEVRGGQVTLRPAGGGPVAEPAPDASSAAEPASYAAALEVLGRLWLAGIEVAWPTLHAPERRRRVPLPAYPFERQRFWVDPLPEDPKPDSDAPCLYHPVWKSTWAADTVPAQGRRCLVFADSLGLGAAITERTRAAGAEVVTVTVGAAFAGDPAAGYTLDPAQPGHYARLWEDLRKRGALPERVIHLWSTEALDPAAPASERFRRACDLGFYSLLHLAAARPAGALTIKVVSTGLYDVVSGEPIAPEKAPLAALCRVLPQEEESLQCALIDVEAPGDRPLAFVDPLLAELGSATPEPVAALRHGRRWVPHYEPVPAEVGAAAAAATAAVATPERPPSGLRVRPGGVYLITGGLGHVSFVLAAALARHRAKLVLTGRSGLLPRADWDAWLQSHDATHPTTIRIRKVQALELMGSEVLVVPADAADRDQTRAAVRAAQDRFGGLHGVIHAAGELSADTFRAARELSRETCERQFAPKVEGLLALAEAVDGLPLDFCVVTSSLSTVLGGVGYAAYAGANAFMDAFVARKNQDGGPGWRSIDWDQWDFGSGTEAPGRQAVRKGPGLQGKKGFEAFERILRLPGVERVVVTAGPLAARLERWGRLPPPSSPAQAEAVRPRPALASAYAAPRSEPERLLAGIWQDLLGLDRVGIHDNFFELGGHSLFAARVLSRVRAAFGVSLPLEAIFDAPTVAELAGRVVAAGWAKAAAEGSGTEAARERVEIEI